MGENSKIEWTHHTFNPWRGCTKVSAGCDNCYAEKMSGRNPKTLGIWGKHGTRVVASDARWREPLKWNEAAEQAGERHRVFCASLADVFEGEDTMPEASWQAVDDARQYLFRLIERTPHLDWLLLTKRPENVIPLWLTPDCGSLPEERAYAGRIDLPPNVWIGTSVEDQKTADERIPHLLQIPAKVRFLSMEPLLGPVDLSKWLRRTLSVDELNALHAATGGMEAYGLACQQAEGDNGFDWVIVGGESGPNARPMHPDWVRSIRDQCQAAGVPFFLKQWGEFLDIDTAIREGHTSSYDGKYHPYTRIDSTSLPFVRIGKKRAGRLLDGREWNELPEVA